MGLLVAFVAMVERLDDGDGTTNGDALGLMVWAGRES